MTRVLINQTVMNTAECAVYLIDADAALRYVGITYRRVNPAGG